MDRDAIIREWFYRLPKGYANAPYSKKEMNVLHEVLAENGLNGSVFVNEVDQLDQAFHDAKPVKDLDEAVVEDFNLSQEFLAVLQPKLDDFEEFLAGMPGGTTNIMLQNFFDNMTDQEQAEFVKMLYSRNSIEQIDKNDYTKGVGAKLYNLEPKGIGRGEIFLAALIKGAKVSGGGESFDLTVGSNRYEVKDYRTSDSAAIRLGTKGNVVRFPFWKQLIGTLELMEDLENFGAFDNIDNKEVKAFAEYLRTKKKGGNRYQMIPTGEFNKTDIKQFTAGYKALNDFAQTDAKGYTMITLRGPNIKPKALTIDEIPADIKDKLTINVQSEAGLENLITRLRRIEYIRKPDQLEKDIQNTVNKTVGQEIPFIVFRKNDIKITKDFKLATISQGGIKIIEKE
tara:strand:+ start:7230 stop:8423 length:1194 start_codon:yes stop_codon:yes gene_type:complete